MKNSTLVSSFPVVGLFAAFVLMGLPGQAVGASSNVCKGVVPYSGSHPVWNLVEFAGTSCANNTVELETCGVPSGTTNQSVSRASGGECEVAIELSGTDCSVADRTTVGDNCADEKQERQAGTPENQCTVDSSDNPIYFGSGNKFLQAADFVGNGAQPLAWIRTYNSIDQVWRFSYSQYIDFFSDLQVDVHRSDGKLISFYSSGSDWEVFSDVRASLSHDATLDQWSVTYPNDTVEVYNNSGQLISITNRNGQSTTLTYTSGELTSVQGFAGRSITLTHANGRVASMTDPAGNVTEYQYDANGQLEYVVYPDDTPLSSTDNPRVQYHYEDANSNALVTGMTDELGVRYATYVYDASGQATLSELAGNVESTSVVYNVDGTVSVTNELGTTADYTFTNANGMRVTTQIDGEATTLCAATTASIAYDANGFVDTRTDRNGNVTDFTYNTRGLVESRTEAFGTSDARTTTTTWHSSFNVPTQIVRPGQTETMTYDAAGRLLTRTITDTQTQTVPYVTTNNTRVWTYTYNAQGLVATIDGPRTDVSDVTTFAYDANGDLTTTTNALSQVTEIISRDARGLPTAIDDVNDTRTELSYDKRGRLLSRTVKSSQGDVVTSFAYDLAGQLIRVDLPTGGFLAYEYDGAHRLIAITNDHEERVAYTLDDAGNATKIEHKGPGGVLLQTQDQVFDELSRLREWVDGVNNDTDYDYDVNDNQTSMTDGLNRTSSQTFDAFDRIETATDAASGVVTYAYDDRGNLVSVTDPRSVVTSYVYDGLDNLIQEVSADAGSTTYVYDAAGNLTQATDGRGVVVNYTYDALNRMLTASYPASTGENVTYTYDTGTDGLGRLAQITDESGSTSYTYDDRGNVTQEVRVIDGTTYTTSYSYNLADQVISMTYPSGRVVNIDRDTQGRTTEISHTLSGLTEYLIDNVAYDGRGALSAIQFGNGVYQTMTYDAAGRPSVRTLTDTYNAAPVAYTDSAATVTGVSIDIDVIANDRDFNADVLTIHGVTQPATGSVSINGDQTLNYTPSGSTAYTTTFTYQATDGAGPSNFATVTVVVDAPAMTDTDGDGLTDVQETNYGLDPNDATDAVADIDGDGVDNVTENANGTDPFVNDAGLSSAISSLSPFIYWKFDETSGTTFADSSGNGWNGTFNGTYSLNQASALESGVSTGFSNGYGRLAHNSALNLSGDYTIEGLVRFSSGGYTYIHSKYSGSAGVGTLVTNHNGRVRFLENSAANVWSNRYINDGRWHHLSFVRRGDDMEIWVDGELDAVQTVTQPVMTTSTEAIEVMGRWSGYRTDGAIDDWAIHQQALAPAQIKAHFMSLGDKDLDAVPTSSEIANFHDPVDANDATADYDGDGASQYDEYIAGTDPMVNPNGYAASVTTDTPTGFWPLDDVTTTAADASGNGHSGAYHSTYTQSQTAAITSGDSVAFTAGGRVVVPNDTDLKPQGDYTIEGYYKWTGTNYGMLYGIWTPGGNAPGPIVFSNHDGANEVAGELVFRDSGANGYYLAANRTGLNDDTWRHFAFVRRGSQLEIYIDGILDGSRTLSSVIAHTPTTDLYMMGRETIQQVTGSADQVAFYDHALSAEDIMQRVIQGQTPPPVVKTNSRELPKHLDRWLEPGTLIALLDLTQDQTVEIYRMTESHAWSNVEDPTTALLAKANIRATRDAKGVSVYFGDGDQWIHRRVPNGIKTGLLPVASAGLSETWTYTYDAVSNITQIVKPGGTDSYGYDDLDRLDDYTLPGSAQVTYTYDALGNRLTETQSGVTQTHTYGTTDNRLMTQAGSALTYDGAGNIISDQAGVRTFSYNHRNRLTQVVDNAVTVGTYTYNALGQRVRKVAGSVDTDYVYDLNGQLIGEYNNGTVVKEYVYFDGVPMAQIESSGTTWFHADHLGTPRVGTDQNDAIVWRWESDPFGEAAPNEDPDGDLTDVTVNLRFPGQYVDMESDQYYNYFRTYSPSIGRYTQSDPIGLSGGPNSYAYVGGNPISFADPLGLRTCLLTTVGPAGIRDHAAVYTSRGDGNGGPALYDPAGSYGFANGAGSGGIVVGDAASIEAFKDYHESQEVEVACEDTRQAEEEDIIDAAFNEPFAGAFQCAIRASNVLSGQPSFPGVQPGTFWPGNLRRQVVGD